MISNQDINIIVKDVSKSFVAGGQCVALMKEVNAIFEQGKSYAIMGVSGVGKSTFLHMLAGIESCTTGQILYGQQSIAKMTDKQRQSLLADSVGLVFQEARLISCLSIAHNVMLKAMIAGGKSHSQLYDQAKNLLNIVGLNGCADQLPDTLSRGQQQRVALARALFTRPQFLIADEPTASLDQEGAQALIVLLHSLQSDFGMGIILSTHDHQVAKQMGRVLKIEQNLLVDYMIT